jgi:hypothetical protein
MAIYIETYRYVAAHGKQPRGTGYWAFERESSHNKPVALLWAPPLLTYREAAAWCRRELRRQGWQDATVHVAT